MAGKEEKSSKDYAPQALLLLIDLGFFSPPLLVLLLVHTLVGLFLLVSLVLLWLLFLHSVKHMDSIPNSERQLSALAPETAHTDTQTRTLARKRTHTQHARMDGRTHMLMHEHMHELHTRTKLSTGGFDASYLALRTCTMVS